MLKEIIQVDLIFLNVFWPAKPMIQQCFGSFFVEQSCHFQTNLFEKHFHSFCDRTELKVSRTLGFIRIFRVSCNGALKICLHLKHLPNWTPSHRLLKTHLYWNRKTMVPKEAQIVAVFSSSYSCLDNIIVINQRSKTQIVMFLHQRACKLSLLTSFFARD